MSRTVNPTTLAPDISAATLDDTLPNHIALFDLVVDPPALWDEQPASCHRVVVGYRARWDWPDEATCSPGLSFEVVGYSGPCVIGAPSGYARRSLLLVGGVKKRKPRAATPGEWNGPMRPHPRRNPA